MKILALIIAFAISMAVYGQEYKIASGESDISITGTSTIHDWEASVENYSGSADFTVEDGVLTSINDLNFNVVVRSINSGKGGMDKKIYEALKEKKHKEISFVAKKITEINENTITAAGDLTVAGVTKPVQLTATYEVFPDGSILVTGSYPMTMKEFNVDPPTAMFGTIKSGNEIEVKFNTKFVNAQNS